MSNEYLISNIFSENKGVIKTQILASRCQGVVNCTFYDFASYNSCDWCFYYTLVRPILYYYSDNMRVRLLCVNCFVSRKNKPYFN